MSNRKLFGPGRARPFFGDGAGGFFVPPTTITPEAPALVTPPVITGTPVLGNELVCDGGQWAGYPAPVLTYQWLRDGVQIPGATSDSYITTLDDLGHEIKCAVLATNYLGTDYSVSNPLGPIAGGPVITLGVTADGDPIEGETLTLTPPQWASYPAASVTYQWWRTGSPSNVAIPGATGTTYTIQSADVGRYIYVEATISNGSNAVISVSNLVGPATAAPEAPVNAVAPVVSGTPTEGQVLSCSTGTWTGTPTPTYAYQWQRDAGAGWSNIFGATSSTYLLQATQIGATVRCVVTATNSTGAASANSNAVGPIASSAVLPVNTVAPVVSGTVRMDEVLSCSTGTWTGTPTPTYAYQWRRGTVPIAGATGSTYTVVGADIAGLIDCVVTATNAAGSVSQESSNTLASPWQPILSIKPNAVIFDGRDPYCMGGASVGSPVETVRTVNGLLIGTQAISSKRAQRTSLGLSFDGGDDEYPGEAALLSRFNGDHSLIASVSSASTLTNRALLHAYLNGSDLEYIRVHVAYAASTARNYYRRQSIGATYTLVQYPLATTWKMVVTTALGTPGTSNLYDLTSGVTLHQTASAALIAASLEAWKFGGNRDNNAWMQGVVECFGFDASTWDTTTIGVFRSCAVNAGVM